MKIYKGNTLSELVRQYSCDRMQRDPAYRAEVHAAVQARKVKSEQTT